MIADIDVFQTVTSVSFQVEPNTNVININKITIENGGLQDLQSVTNVGATTTNAITINVESSDSGVLSTSLGHAIDGNSTENNGVRGYSVYGAGVYGISDESSGVYGVSYGINAGVYGYSDTGLGIVGFSDIGNGASITSLEGTPIETFGNGSGTPSIDVNLGNSNKGVVIESGTSSIGNPIEVKKNGVTKFVVNQEGSVIANQITLNTAPTETAVVGTTRWNNTTGTSETTLKGGTVVLKNGFDLLARIVNKVTPNQTLTKANYQAVRISGATGQRLSVQLAQGNTDLNSADTIGLVTETIATNQEGFIVTMGQIEEINTTGSLQGETWVDGDVLYLSPTTAGKLTNIKPNGAIGHIIVIGYVEYAHAIHGKIYVKIMNGWELDELHNVFIDNPLNNEGLFYETATQLWKNKPISTVLGYTPVASNTAIVGATKTKITYDAKGLVTSGTDATTADIADSVNRRYITDAQQTVITNTSGTNTGDNATNTQYSGLATSKANVASPIFTGTVTTPAIIVSSETASTLASFDASKNNKYFTATYGGLTLTESDPITTGFYAPNLTPVLYNDVVFANVEFADFIQLQNDIRTTRGYITTYDNNGLEIKIYPVNMKYENLSKELTIKGEEKFTSTFTPTIETVAITDISSGSASSGGNILSNGYSPITAKGIVWSINPNPTTALSTKTSQGTGDASFTSALTPLNQNTLYYVRAYATNSNGTSYGSQVSFTTDMLIPIAYNDTYNVNNEDVIDLFPMSNDVLGAVPTTITAINATGITSGIVTISGSGSKLNFDPNGTQAEGQTLTYTITDSQSNTSTATITLNVIAEAPPTTAYFTAEFAWGQIQYVNELDVLVVQNIYDGECVAITYKEIIYSYDLITCVP